MSSLFKKDTKNINIVKMKKKSNWLLFRVFIFKRKLLCIFLLMSDLYFLSDSDYASPSVKWLQQLLNLCSVVKMRFPQQLYIFLFFIQWKAESRDSSLLFLYLFYFDDLWFNNCSLRFLCFDCVGFLKRKMCHTKGENNHLEKFLRHSIIHIKTL